MHDDRPTFTSPRVSPRTRTCVHNRSYLAISLLRTIYNWSVLQTRSQVFYGYLHFGTRKFDSIKNSSETREYRYGTLRATKSLLKILTVMGDDVNDVVTRTFACAGMGSQDHRETRGTIGDSVRRQFWHSLTMYDIRDERERSAIASWALQCF